MKAGGRSRLIFLSQFARHPRELGTFTQSSRTLARRIAREIDGANHVVELGAGLGPITREILKHLPADGELTSFESNAEFCRCLENLNDRRLHVVHEDAVHSERYVEAGGCVICGLPLALFSKEKRRRLLRIMSKADKCVLLQYTPRLGGEMRGHFRYVKVKIVPWNIPPALVYVATQVEPTGTH